MVIRKNISKFNNRISIFTLVNDLSKIWRKKSPLDPPLGNQFTYGLFRVRPNNKMTSLLPNFTPFGGLVVPYEKTFCAKLQTPN